MTGVDQYFQIKPIEITQKELILVSLPIGNLGDITLRALETLRVAPCILCEDTRVLKKLLSLYQIDYSGKKIISFHEHSSFEKLDQLIPESFIYVSDAGSPAVSDPAHQVIKWAKERGYQILSCPGVSASLCALELSGLDPQNFHFYGFFPRKSKEQNLLLQEILTQKGTHIFFESPQRIQKTIQYLGESLQEQNFCVARELTKKFETLYHFKGKDWSQVEINPKGEFVLLIENKEALKQVATGLEELARNYLSSQRKKELSKLLAEILETDSKTIYQKLSENNY